MNSDSILLIFFGTCGIIFGLAQLLWAVYTYLRERGYICHCMHHTRSHGSLEFDIVRWRIATQMDVQETWV